MCIISKTCLCVCGFLQNMNCYWCSEIQWYRNFMLIQTSFYNSYLSKLVDSKGNQNVGSLVRVHHGCFFYIFAVCTIVDGSVKIGNILSFPLSLWFCKLFAVLEVIHSPSGYQICGEVLVCNILQEQ